ncbi:electron transport complex subunit RsxD [Marinihelvus fidelis]|uniref:Ion-translocating oxidoreductase complex subunit D n=1 Tax=Marinihelvus fidelis TaxID=2613842 RepID=A0A5N0TEH8_9GAMM|nr:electron transport complex subunit RsxD [Marinihelvus fidelis]KAA9132497.1 electron transport complex subunit RsxD [Marinihelvus fidelis]
MTRAFSSGPAPHMPAPPTVAGVMTQVLIALVPGIIASAWFFGPGVLVQIVLASGFALAFEALFLRCRGRALQPFISDGSAVVTAVLFALCVPPLAPWWVAAIGMAAAIGLAKHLYGGLGQNPFNPAMVGYVVALVCFPAAMTQWLSPREIATAVPDLAAVLQAIFTGTLPGTLSIDAVTRATPLDSLKTGVEAGRFVSEIRQSPVFGDFGGRGWEWIANAYALGGLWLMYRRIISWHVPVAVIGSVLLISLPAWLLDPGANPEPLQHVFSGGLVLGAFFIATDPVSGCASPRGRLIFGAGVGIITLVIRRWGGYPDGVAFGVLLMNMAAPLIDRYTRPRVYGR